jgi:hypothetical protein
MVAAALIIGFVLQMVIQQQTLTGQVGNTTVVYPASWVQIEEEGAGFAAADLNGSGAFGPRVSLREFDKADLRPNLIGPEEGSLLDAATNWSLRRGQDLVGYRVLDITQGTVQGREVVHVESAYLLDSTRGAATNTMPGLMHVVDTLVESGDKYYILTFATEAGQFDSQSGLRERLLNDWRIP